MDPSEAYLRVKHYFISSYIRQNYAYLANVYRYNLRLPAELRSAVEARAKGHLRSINNEIIILLKLGLVNRTEESNALNAADKILSQLKKE